MTHTHCSTRLGDNLAHIHLLRALAIRHTGDKFIHHALPEYAEALREAVIDLPNVEVSSTRPPSGSVEVWKGRDGAWYKHRNRNDYSGFYLEWHERIAHDIGYVSPFQVGTDLLFDWPLLKTPSHRHKFDFLVINSPPQSGQFLGFDFSAMVAMIERLKLLGSVVTTWPPVFSLSGLGQLSQCCRCVVMVSTGASWPTFNVWNKDLPLRVVLIDSEDLSGLGDRMVHTNKIQDVPDIVRSNL